MEVIKTEIEGVVIIEPRIFKDARGYFFESYSQREFNEKVAQIDFCQDNESMSSTEKCGRFTGLGNSSL
jgi:dTDP-4-dehydrorhamnose 3,5-epimerase